MTLREELRIRGELDRLKADPISHWISCRSLQYGAPRNWAHDADMAAADAILFYSAGDGGGDLMSNVNQIDGLGKHVVFFVRHRSGPLITGTRAPWRACCTSTRTRWPRSRSAMRTSSLTTWMKSAGDCGRCAGYTIRSGAASWRSAVRRMAQPAGVVPNLVRERGSSISKRCRTTSLAN